MANNVNWRWIFIVILFVVAVSLLVGVRVIRESRDKAEGRRFDPPARHRAAFRHAVHNRVGRHRAEKEKHGWGHFTSFAWLIVVAGLTAAFVAWEIREGRIRHPHIPLSLVRSRNSHPAS